MTTSEWKESVRPKEIRKGHEIIDFPANHALVCLLAGQEGRLVVVKFLPTSHELTAAGHSWVDIHADLDQKNNSGFWWARLPQQILTYPRVAPPSSDEKTFSKRAYAYSKPHRPLKPPTKYILIKTLPFEMASSIMCYRPIP